MEADPDYQRRQTQRERLLACNRDAAHFFYANALHPRGEQPMLDHLKRRGVSDGVIRKFGLGAAPNSWDALTRAMQAKGYTTEELQMAGLIVIKDAEEATADRPARPRRAFDMFLQPRDFPHHRPIRQRLGVWRARN